MTAIGIDLGTTYSCVGIYKGGKVDIIANEMGNKTTPSIVSFTDDETYIGEAAKLHAPRNPSNTIYGAKRMIGRDFDDPDLQRDIASWPFTVKKDSTGRPKIFITVKGKEQQYYPEQISSMVLKKMKEIAETSCTEKITNAVITVPAYFNDGQRSSTKEAGRLAGLNVLRIINEPTAAAIAFGLSKSDDDNHTALIFDLGGGTFDVSILNINDGVFEVRSTNGDTHLGGEDFDNNVVKYIADKFNEKYKCDVTKNQRTMIILKDEVEKAKRIISIAKSAIINIDNFFEGHDLNERLSRATFNDLNVDTFTRCIPPIMKALQDADLEASEITDLVLVGGSSRIPYVKELLLDIFPHLTPYAAVHPDEAVAYGAAVQAYNIIRDDADDDDEDEDACGIILCDACAHTYGIEVEGQKMYPLIKANSTIPTVARGEFTTTADNQTTVDIFIFEGENEFTKDNHFMGQFRVEGIKPMLKGEATVNVKYKLTVDGVLDVEVEADGGAAGKAHINRLTNSFVAGKPKRGSAGADTAMCDICYCVDATGSMGSMIKAAQDKVIALSEQLKRERPKIDFAFSAVFYRDPVDCSGDQTNIYPLTNKIEVLRSGIMREKASGGGDGPEDWVGCYRKALDSIRWRPGSFRIVIHIADAPAHGNEWGGACAHQDQGPLLTPLIERLAKGGFYFSGICMGAYPKPSFNRIKEIYNKHGVGDRFIMQDFDSSPSDSAAADFFSKFVVTVVTSIVPK